MDILGSIMKKMEKPPQLGEKERKIRKMQQEALKKEQEEKEVRVAEFKKRVTNEISTFVDDPEKSRHKFPPMDKAFRALLFSIAEDAGLVAHSFGREDVDRHVMVFKEGDSPSDVELSCLKRGEEFVPGVTGVVKETDAGDHTSSEQTSSRRGRKSNVPPEYLHKYEKHLGGLRVAKEAAVNVHVEDGKVYGFVSSEQKRDKRTIEETLADIRARKRNKQE